MSKTIELREKRAKAWEAAKAFLDTKRGTDGLLSAEDVATYEKMENDVVTLGKEIDRLERQEALDRELSRPINTPITGKPATPTGEVKTGRASDEYKGAFWKAMKNKMSFEVQNALTIGTDSEGGYLVPDEFEQTIIDSLADVNIIRQLSNVMTTSSGDKKIPVSSSHGTAAWTDEGGAYNESDDSFGIVTLGAHKLTTIIKVSEELINDSVFNIERYIAKEFARRISVAEEEAFITGNGTGRPTGLLVTGEVGVTALSATAITTDELIDLYHSLREPYRQKAVFITNDDTIRAIRKLKDGEGQYLWKTSLQDKGPDTILGMPIKTSIYMPKIASAAKTVAFGDFSNYWIADRQGRSFQRLNELYAATGQVGFKASQRVDGKLVLVESVKVLKQKT